MIHTIISGGQTGADMGALQAAKDCGIHTAGFAVQGFRTEQGCRVVLLRDGYGLTETDRPSYAYRTRLNVGLADATLVICPKFTSAGSEMTRRFAREMRRPLLSIQNLTAFQDVAIEVQEWIEANDVATLNVAGNRESVHPGIYDWTRKMMRCVLDDKWSELYGENES